MLPLPNPDAHEVIGAKIELEPRKVFFGINLVRQKMKLPKLPFPKRKLAISPEQMYAIQNLYIPLLPLPPIGCHKIIAAQLKMDEWRVHVGIGLIRKKIGLERWNPTRPDAPEEFKQKALEEANKPKKKLVLLKKTKEEKEEPKKVSKKKEVTPVVIKKLEDVEEAKDSTTVESATLQEEEKTEVKPKRSTKKKAETKEETAEVVETEAKPKRTSKKKAETNEETAETEVKPKRGRKKKEE